MLNFLREGSNERLVARSIGWPEAQGKVLTNLIVWEHSEVEYEYSVGNGHYIGIHKVNLFVLQDPSEWRETKAVKMSVANSMPIFQRRRALSSDTIRSAPQSQFSGAVVKSIQKK